MRLLFPKTFHRIHPGHGPLFFLAGPVRGAGDWQWNCCELINAQLPHFYAALPCRYTNSHPALAFALTGPTDKFDRQLTWERHYIEQAALAGCLIFWLPCEKADDPRVGDEPYAMDTRGELGEWRGRMMNDPRLRIVVGAEPNFPGLSQIQRNFTQALQRPFVIHDSLNAVVHAALELLRSSSA